ncbi:hypothetical protein A2U01_0115092, partial [Trifolium medium]|nr:hypothetical protein [Trifolium medium]
SLARRAGVLARRAVKASGGWFWFWPLHNAQPWMVQRAVLRAGVALATVVCAARRGACAARERDAYL